MGMSLRLIDAYCPEKLRMYVYFLKARGEDVLIKIGRSRDPERRVSELQTGSPFKLKLLGRVRCKNDFHAKQVEKAVHRIFHHCRRRGEWFKLSKQTLSTLHQIIKDANQDEVDMDRAEQIHRELDSEFRAIVG